MIWGWVKPPTVQKMHGWTSKRCWTGVFMQTARTRLTHGQVICKTTGATAAVFAITMIILDHFRSFYMDHFRSFYHDYYLTHLPTRMKCRFIDSNDPPILQPSLWWIPVNQSLCLALCQCSSIQTPQKSILANPVMVSLRSVLIGSSQIRGASPWSLH